MADVDRICEDGYHFATQAVAYDTKGETQSAVFFYTEAANCLAKALSYDNTLDVRDKAFQYIQRAELLRSEGTYLWNIPKIYINKINILFQ